MHIIKSEKTGQNIIIYVEKNGAKKILLRGRIVFMYRKDSIIIEEWLKSSDKALLVTGARQIGKTWLIREEISQKRIS